MAGGGVVHRADGASPSPTPTSKATDRLLDPVFTMKYIRAAAPIEWNLEDEHYQEESKKHDGGGDGVSLADTFASCFFDPGVWYYGVAT